MDADLKHGANRGNGGAAATREMVNRIYERSPKTAAERATKRMLEYTPGLPRQHMREGCFRTMRLMGNDF